MVGGGNVHVVSYEGMAAAGKDLKDILACGIVMVEGCVDGRLPGMVRNAACHKKNIYIYYPRARDIVPEGLDFP